MLRFLFALLTLTFAASGARGQACTTTWQPERVGTTPQGDPVFSWTDGSWGTASRWSAGVPGPSDVACITGPSDQSVSFTVTGATGTVAGLVVEGIREQAPTTAIRLVTAGLTVTGPGLLGDNERIDGDLTIGGTFVVENGNLVRGGGTLRVTGTLLVEAGDGNGGFGNGSQIGDRSAAGSPSTLVLDGGRFEAREAVSVLSRLEADGATLVQRFDTRGNSGQTAWFWTGGTVRNSSFDIEAGSGMLLGGDFEVSGTLGGTSDGDLSFSQDPVTFGDGSLTVGASGVTMAVGGTQGLALRVPQTSSRPEYEIGTEGGEILNAGLLRLPAVSRTFRGVTLRSTGTVRFEQGGRATLVDGADVVIEEAGTLAFSDIAGQGNQGLDGPGPFGTSPTGDERLIVRGRVVEAGNGTADQIGLPVDVEGGTLVATSGVLRITGGGTWTNAVADVRADARLAFGSPRSDLLQTYTLSGSVTGSSDGLFGFDGPSGDTTSVVLDGAVRFNVGGAVGLVTGTSGVNSGRVALRPAAGGGSLVNEGRFASTTSGLTVDNLAVRNEGTFGVTGQYTLAGDAEVVNATGGTLTFQNASPTSGDVEGQFINEGVAVVTSNSSTQPFRGRLVGRPGSEIRAATGFSQNGTSPLSFAAADTVAYAVPGVVLSGRGNLSFTLPSSEVLLPGTISPGSPEAPFDSLSVTVPRFTPTSRLVVDLGPGTADYVYSQNRFELDGTLVLRLADDLDVNVGDEFVIGRFNSSSTTPTGQFDAVEVVNARSATFEVVTSEPGALIVRAVTATPSEAGPEEAEAFTLAAPHPNPARGAVTIGLGVGRAAPVHAAVYDALGREVAVLWDGPLAAGPHELRLNAAPLAAGLYVVRVGSGADVQTRTLTVVR